MDCSEGEIVTIHGGGRSQAQEAHLPSYKDPKIVRISEAIFIILLAVALLWAILEICESWISSAGKLLIVAAIGAAAYGAIRFR